MSVIYVENAEVLDAIDNAIDEGEGPSRKRSATKWCIVQDEEGNFWRYEYSVHYDYGIDEGYSTKCLVEKVSKTVEVWEPVDV